MKTRESIALTVVALCFTATPARAVEYNVVDLGRTGEPPTYAFALNNNGIVVGQYQVYFSGDSYLASFSWDSGALTGWHVFGSKSGVNGVNDSGMMIGWSDGAEHPYSGYVGENGINVNLPELAGQSWSYADAINNSDQIAGSSGNYAAVWTRDPCEPNDWLPTALSVSGYTYAKSHGINEIGEVVGRGESPGVRAALWTVGTTNGIVLPYPAASGSWDIAADINDAGDVIVGESISSGQSRAAIWELNGGWSGRLLGNLGGAASQALAVSNDGLVVGWSETSEGVEHAFCYDQLNGMQDLNSMIDAASGWVLNRAYAVNDAGFIVGYGTVDGETHAFLLAEVLDADLNRDYRVDVADLGAFCSQWLMCTNPEDPLCEN